MKVGTALSFLLGLTSASASSTGALRNTEGLSSKDWITLDNGVEFQPGDDIEDIHAARQLWFGRNKNKNANDAISFIDATETSYDSNAQAWRMLGFYTDCGVCDAANDYSAAYCVEKGTTHSCQRYLMWAAYVDTGYEGNGVNEYRYYNRSSKKWTDTCDANGSTRCKRMDCHEATTHFSLLGVYKEPDYGNWLDILAEYQGDCVWTDKEYKAVHQNKGGWPEQCTYVENGLYYDAKPSYRGNLEIGLYSDQTCMTAYKGMVTPQEVINNLGGGSSSNSLKDELSLWNSAYSAFKTCQPCRATNFHSVFGGQGNTFNSNGDRYQHRNNANDDAEGNNNNNYNNYQCGAEYNDEDGQAQGEINQCRLFSKNTYMQTATYRDVAKATSQGTVTGIKVGNTPFGRAITQRSTKQSTRNWISALAFITGLLTMCCCINHYGRTKRAYNRSMNLNEPLVSQARNAYNNNTNNTYVSNGSRGRSASGSRARSSRSRSRSGSHTRSSSYDRAYGETRNAYGEARTAYDRM